MNLFISLKKVIMEFYYLIIQYEYQISVTYMYMTLHCMLNSLDLPKTNFFSHESNVLILTTIVLNTISQ